MAVNGIGNSKADIRPTQLKAGMEKTNLKNDKDKAIFDAMDTDKNGVLDQSEIEKFKQTYDKNGDDIATKKEAKKFIKDNGLKGSKIKKKDVIKFLRQSGVNTENVQDTEIQENGAVKINYKDGTSKTVNKDKSYSTTKQNADEETVTDNYDADNNHLSNTVGSKDKNTTTTTFYKDGKRVSDVVTDKANNTQTETSYDENDKPEIKVTVNNSTQARSEIKYTNGEPTTEEVRQGDNISSFEYVEGKRRIKSKIENKGNDALEKTTNYTYNEDSTVTEEISQLGAKTTTTNTLNADGHKLSQKKVVDGKEYNLTYDGEGNTKGVIVQNGETIADIAKKFNVSKDSLKEVNKDILGNNKSFKVGDEIKLPKELEADEPALQGRKSASQAKADYAHDQQIKREQAALRKQRAAAAAQRKAVAAQRKVAAAQEEAQLKGLGLTNHKGADSKVDAHYAKTNRKVKLTKIGNATHGRTICKDGKGKVYVVAQDGVILKDTYVKVSAHRKVVKLKNGARVAVDGSRKDGHGRSIVYDANGKQLVMSHDNKILKSSYVARSDRADIIRKNKGEAHKATVEMMDKQLKDAQADI